MPIPSNYAIKTYRYLRLAMVTMIFLLAVSLVIEWGKTDPHCWQTSISAYYYTPAQAIVVGTLIAIGACMVAIKGNTEGEDILLNVGGMLAPAVALVPTPGAGECRSVPMTVSDTSANIANNMAALFVTGVVILGITITIALRARQSGTGDWDRRHVAGLVVATVVLGGGIAWFAWNRSGFTTGAHYTAAAILFVCIGGVVVLNAKEYRRKVPSKRPTVNRYSIIAAAMAASLVVMGLWKWIFGWEHAVLWIEGALITLFALFWLSQTQELWHEGLRTDGAQPTTPDTSAAPSSPESALLPPQVGD